MMMGLFGTLAEVPGLSFTAGAGVRSSVVGDGWAEG
jgi:hypothetical protein